MKGAEGEGRRFRLRTVVATGTAGVVLGAAGLATVQQVIQEQKPVTKPGGVWISPKNGQQVTGSVHLEAQAYPTNPGDPTIAYVNFTANVNGTWRSVCRVTPPPPTEVPKFGCEWTPPKTDPEIPLSFDVYDAEGNVNKQPHGPRTIFVSS